MHTNVRTRAKMLRLTFHSRNALARNTDPVEGGSMLSPHSIYFHEDDHFLSIINTNSVQTKTFSPKDTLHLEKRFIYFIKSGVIKIYVFNAEGQKKLLWLLGSGCMIPTFNLNFQKSIICLKTTKIIRIDKSYFISSLVNNDLFEESHYRNEA